ncbi:hypothetical protein EHQ27_16705 [Leptospira wolffii]|uniref:hypothetical protein n=1 Tax=Leptospira wolffii TaxID=409998 RepID=UPI0010847F06|nr:hypothetical protein [Leptospira wolffii]TGK62233.1 hypothetical protein EHQ32_05220 [Leptospira wolffii]TGK66605.1 hypothetical protein EHQ27_16705 [Leptospira wolffii]TGK74383.1 hypothetical protein EHQ35_08555 [Leptospira wolffii]TGL32042.1 hypothetical protein EHQ57_04120 [Leptospira wolffii]
MDSPVDEIASVAEQLNQVQKALDLFREKQQRRESVSEAAVEFVEKAVLVLDRAERKEIVLTEDQKRRIRSNLLKIRASLIKNQEG